MRPPSFHKIIALEKQILLILNRDWAPIEGAPADEYDAFAPELTKMRLAETEARAMVLYLEWAEEQMGLQLFDTHRALRVAEAIRAVRI